MCFSLGANSWVVGISTMMVAMSVIGIQGIMSATSTVDFGGSKNAGAAVGMVDGLFYAGTSLQSFASGYLTPVGEAAKHAKNWIAWPVLLVPFALAGLYFSLRIWSALPATNRSAATRAPQPPAEAPPSWNRFPGADVANAGRAKKAAIPVSRLAS
jgi:OPA family glycerol-3-phosphate transporter-like MFS transporter